MAEVRRLILAMSGPEEEHEFRLGGSLWRRVQQDVARHCHRAARAKRPTSQRTEASPVVRAVLEEAVREAPCVPLTDDGWERVRSLLPPQKPRVGRPRRDQRVVVDAILWVLGTGSS